MLDLSLLPMSKSVFESMPNPKPVSETVYEISENPNFVIENGRFGNVYLRKKMVVSESVQVQESNPDPENEVAISNSSLQVEIESHVGNDDLDLPIAVRKGTRECTKRPLYFLAHFLSFKHFSPSHKAFLINLKTVPIPTILSEALSNEKWKQAMNEEMEALEKNKTWELMKLPVGKKIVGCKWVYTVKYRADKSIERYKAWLVAKGYTQVAKMKLVTYEIDNLETFAQVAKMNTVRILLLLAANYGWEL